MDKRIAIISNGPSAKLFDGRLCYDAVIGVNWTVSRWLCDWWVFCDWITFATTIPLGNPSLYVREAAHNKIETHAPEHFERYSAHPEVVLHPEKIRGFHHKWSAFSGLAALGLAVHLNAKIVRVFGADMGGCDDHDGRFGGSRTPERWAWELEVWEKNLWAMKQRGIVVERVLL